MRTLIDEEIIPRLNKQFTVYPRHVKILRTIGIGESTLYDKIKDQFRLVPDISIAFLPQQTGVDIRLTDMSQEPGNSEHIQLLKAEQLFRERIGIAV